MCRYCRVARQIVDGQGGWGNAPGRWRKLQAAGYDWRIVQDIVNIIVHDPTRRVLCYR